MTSSIVARAVPRVPVRWSQRRSHVTLVFPLAASNEHGSHPTLVDASLVRDALPEESSEGAPVPSRVLRLRGGPFARFGPDGFLEGGIDVELFAEATNATVDLRGWPDVVVVRVRKATPEDPYWPALMSATELRLVASVDWDRWEDEEAEDEDPGPEPGAWTSTMAGAGDDEGDEEEDGSEDDADEDDGEEYAKCEENECCDDDEDKDDEEDDEAEEVEVEASPSVDGGPTADCIGALEEVSLA